MGISKVWQWIRDKKSHTLRKWRSAFIGGGTASTFEGEERFFASELDVPESNLRPIGGSCNALTRPQSDKMPRKTAEYKKRRASEKVNGVYEPLLAKNDDWDSVSDVTDRGYEAGEETRDETYYNYDDLYGSLFNDLDESVVQRQREQQYRYPQQSETAGNEQNDYDLDEEFEDEFRDRKPSSQYSVSPPSYLPVSALRRPSDASNTPSELGGGRNKRLRFNIPQVQLTSAEEPASPTVLIAADHIPELPEDYEQDQYELELETQCLLAAPRRVSSSSDDDRSAMSEGSCTALSLGMAAAAVSAASPSGSFHGSTASASSAPATPQPVLVHMKTVDFSGLDVKDKDQALPPRRSVTDVERRRQSLAQRRQSNVQLVQSMSGRRNSTTLIPLTLAQIHLVRSLWRQIYVSKGPTVIGQTIIYRLFFKLPKTKDQFRRCPLPRSFPNHDSFAKAHSKAMAELVDSVVDNLDNLEAISGHLEKVGRIHARVIGGELSSKLWNSVAETFIDCTLEWGDKRCRSETVRKAWALITAFIVERIKSGHLEERKQMLTIRSSIQRQDGMNAAQVT